MVADLWSIVGDKLCVFLVMGFIFLLTRMVAMQKKYVVRLSEEGRKRCEQVIKRQEGGSEEVRRAQILLKADADGPAWTDARIGEAFCCPTRTVEIIRQRFVERGLEQTLARKKPDGPSAKKLLDGEQEAKIIAVRLGPPPEGSGSWSLRLVSRRVVELHIVESISHETVRRVLKKTV